MKEKFQQLSEQAKNSLRDLYRGANPTSIKMAFQFQREIRSELEEFFGTTNIDELAIKCSTFCDCYGL